MSGTISTFIDPTTVGQSTVPATDAAAETDTILDPTSVTANTTAVGADTTETPTDAEAEQRASQPGEPGGQTVALGATEDTTAAQAGTDTAEAARLNTGGFPDSYYQWTLLDLSGDKYTGYLFDDSSHYYVGQIVESEWSGQLYGWYVINCEYEYGYDLSSRYGPAYQEGTTYINNYHDEATNQDYIPYNYARGNPSSISGLSYEYDWATVGGRYDGFGYGGYYDVG